MSTSRSTNSAVNASEAEASNRRTPQGLRVHDSVGNLTKEPFIHDKFASLKVAFNHRVKDANGEYQDGTPTFATVKLVGDARREAPIQSLMKGTEIKVNGTMSTELSKENNPKTNEPFKDLVITVFDPRDIEVTRQPKAAAGGNVEAERAPEQPAERRPAQRPAQSTGNRNSRTQYR